MASGALTPRLIPAVVLACALGVASAVGLPVLSAFFIRLDRCGGVVARDGDHLQPWLFRLDHPTGSRLVWFEKGRVYNKPGVGPPGASSVAVAGWSFATATRSDRRFARVSPERLPLPEGFRHDIESRGLVWGLAEDRRGWPLAAVACRVSAPLRTSAPAVLEVAGGAFIPRSDSASSESLASVRVLPLAVVWAGLAADAGAHSALWWAGLTLGVAALRGVRGSIRRTRGHCPLCGYDVGGDFAGGCPECGWGRAPA